MKWTDLSVFDVTNKTARFRTPNVLNVSRHWIFRIIPTFTFLGCVAYWWHLFTIVCQCGYVAHWWTCVGLVIRTGKHFVSQKHLPYVYFPAHSFCVFKCFSTSRDKSKKAWWAVMADNIRIKCEVCVSDSTPRFARSWAYRAAIFAEKVVTRSGTAAKEGFRQSVVFALLWWTVERSRRKKLWLLCLFVSKQFFEDWSSWGIMR